MASTSVETRFAPPWLHAWSVLTASVAVAVLALGAVVTTFRVGMVDPVWPTAPWHLVFIDWTEPKPGFVIEHTHRLAAYLIGCCTIVLALGLWFSARRNGLKWLGVAALTGVIVQGLFGGFRVILHARFGTGFAVIHGCFAQLVFSLLVSLAVLTSARFAAVPLPAVEGPRIRLWSLLLTALVVVQLIWGALLRHTNGALAQRMHVLTAFAVVAVTVWFAHVVGTSPPARQILGRTLILLSTLLALQVSLGVESWLGKFAGVLLPEMQKPTIGQASHRVAHVLVGSFILATTVVQMVLVHSFSCEPKASAESPCLRPAAKQPEVRTGNNVAQLEGTA